MICGGVGAADDKHALELEVRTIAMSYVCDTSELEAALRRDSYEAVPLQRRSRPSANQSNSIL